MIRIFSYAFALRRDRMSSTGARGRVGPSLFWYNSEFSFVTSRIPGSHKWHCAIIRGRLRCRGVACEVTGRGLSARPWSGEGTFIESISSDFRV
jgi:hypothetical protein